MRAVVLLPLAASLLGAQVPNASREPTPRRLGAPTPIEGDFTTVSSVRELTDGRVLISDAKSPALVVHDLRSKRTTPVGSRGRGPNEYLTPGGLYEALGDSIYLIDRGLTRYLVLDAAGRAVGTRPWTFHGVRSYTSDDRDQQRLDAQGRLYSSEVLLNRAAMLARLRASGANSVDSAPLLRYEAPRAVPDTIAQIRNPQVLRSGSGSTVVTAEVAFSPADGWTVTADGRVAVVRAAPYRVEWYAPSGRLDVAGPITSHDVLPVTDADRLAKQEESAAQARQLAQFAVGTTSGGQSQVPTPELKFADTKPPFDRHEILAAADGQVWVKRSRPANANEEIYDVFDQRGVRVDRLSFPARSRVVGVSARHVYVSTLDADDLPHLARYPR